MKYLFKHTYIKIIQGVTAYPEFGEYYLVILLALKSMFNFNIFFDRIDEAGEH